MRNRHDWITLAYLSLPIGLIVFGAGLVLVYAGR